MEPVRRDRADEEALELTPSSVKFLFQSLLQLEVLGEVIAHQYRVAVLVQEAVVEAAGHTHQLEALVRCRGRVLEDVA